MGEYISVISGIALLAVSCLVMIAYRPRSGSNRLDKSAYVLGWAIFLGFAAAAGNAIWWQLLWSVVDNWFPHAKDMFQHVGKYMDGIFKGAATASGVLHLCALALALPEGERDQWRWYQMPFYPSRHWTLMLFGPRKDKK
jgi:hypothetical protein